MHEKNGTNAASSQTEKDSFKKERDFDAISNEGIDANVFDRASDDEFLANDSMFQADVIGNDALKNSTFSALNAAGESPPERQSIAERVASGAAVAQSLDALFGLMREIGASPLEDAALFQALSRKKLFAASLQSVLQALHTAGARFPEDRALFAMLIEQASHADRLEAGIALLSGMSARLPENRVLFEAICQQAVASASWQAFGYYHPAAFTEGLKVAFAALEKSGASLAAHQELFQKVIQQAKYALKIEPLLQVLQDAGAGLPANEGYFRALIEQAAHADRLEAGIALLSDLGARLPENPLLFEAICQQAVASASWQDFAFYHPAAFAEGLKVAFAALEKSGANLATHHELFQKVIQQAKYASGIEPLLQVLLDAGATLSEHPSLFDGAIQQAQYGSALQAALFALTEAGASIFENPSLFEAVIIEPERAHLLRASIDALITTGAVLPEDHALFETVIRMAAVVDYPDVPSIPLSEADSYLTEKKEFFEPLLQQAQDVMLLKPGLRALITAGARLPEDLGLFEALISKEADALKLTVPFRRLITAGACLPRERRLFERVIEQALDASRLRVQLRLLTVSGASLPEHRRFFEAIMDAPDSATPLLYWLCMCGASMVHHAYLYDAFFSGSTPLASSHYLMTKVMTALQHCLSDAHLLLPEQEGYSEQREQILAQISELMDAESRITEGPLNKSPATQALEAILVRLSMIEDSDEAHMRFDDALGYVLQFGEEPDIYLGGLLREANFNHIELTDAHVTRLGEMIQSLSNDFSGIPVDSVLNIIVERLPKAAQHALAMYVTGNYKNMNRLFRGEPQDTDSRVAWISPADGHANLMANFLCGSLVNWSAAQLPKTLMHLEERQILERVFLARGEWNVEAIEALKKDPVSFDASLRGAVEAAVISADEYNKVASLFNSLHVLFPRYGLVDRGENLTAPKVRGDADITARRLANPSIMPSVTSFSVFSEGAAFFRNASAVRTKLETDCSLRPVMNSKEGEILIPAGTAFRYTRDTTGRFFAREISSPGIQPAGSHWSSFALHEAYRNHLRHAYQDEAHHIILDGVQVERPNHGLAHTYRMMLLVDVVIDYFAHHASDDAFKRYCQSVTHEESEWLRVAAAFSITGRESEIAAVDNLSRYDGFRAASMHHLSAFLNKYPPRTADEHMHERVLHAVRWMGNPHYEHGPDIKNDHPDINEKQHRNFIYRILTVAHKLDLPRCYTPQKFERAMAMCRALSTHGEDQNAHYLRMVSYAIDLIRAHGSALLTDISPEGTFRPCAERYRPPFQKVSTSLRMLYEFTEIVPRPKITEKYQFGGPR
ncbi:hypothetical protein E3226_006550 [Legionella geestiana]|uniref:SidE phosphodiesterase domain-containing protein n=1 Tax=Legionella geestiana TaxID=45065 RepID=UPI0010927A18|nr:SidE phosphodiesterase domain-containing protein [Legionella geestiana]QDQ40082.1 hypothetical protein E3226_006550 [Legionella geestiana]